MTTKKKSGHDRKRWRVTFKLPSVKHQHTQRFMELDTDEYSFTVMGYATGVAVQRAWAKLREVPELKGAIIRDCFITVKCLGYYTKADEALEQLLSPKWQCPMCDSQVGLTESGACSSCGHSYADEEEP